MSLMPALAEATDYRLNRSDRVVYNKGGLSGTNCPHRDPSPY